jgi:sirohydrochlorin ferrochelatase
MSKSRSRPLRGLLIVDHGTRSPDANARLAAFAERVARERPDWLVRHAHMELADPSFDHSIDVLVEAGVTEVFVHLHFLGAGFHVRESIPALVEGARSRHPSLTIELSAPLGDDPRLVEIVVGRLDEQTAARDDDPRSRD